MVCQQNMLVANTITNAIALNASYDQLFASLVGTGMGRRTLRAEKLARDVEGLAAHNDNLLAVEQLLGDGAGEATEQVPLAVDDLVHKSAMSSI